MEGLLIWNDVPVIAVQFSDTGEMIRYNARLCNPEYAPLHDDRDTQFLVKWWKRRSVPLSQGHVARMLEEKGFSGPEDWLCQSLGLSLTDCYWVRPAESSLRWKDVNLFENGFSEDLPEADSTDSADPAGTGSYTPNSSLQGELEKTWSIREGKRVLIKGNRGSRSTESMNEVLASLLHKKQGFDNYTDYRLLYISGRSYDYGCICV